MTTGLLRYGSEVKADIEWQTIPQNRKWPRAGMAVGIILTVESEPGYHTLLVERFCATSACPTKMSHTKTAETHWQNDQKALR